MVEEKQIHEFAVRWVNKFRDQKINYKELVDKQMADDCDNIGFKMDCGDSFDKVYGSAGFKSDELDKIVDDITDIYLLGSAIYSRWRYFSYYAFDCVAILFPENRSWFILALSRLALLTGDNPFIFTGIPKEIHIISNNICYGSDPKPWNIVEQEITINSNGGVLYKGYSYGDGYGKYKEAHSKDFNILKENAQNILNKIALYFCDEYDEILATDIGNWKIEVTNTNGKKYEFYGSMRNDIVVDKINLSDLIRNNLDMPNLFVFDGKNKQDIINRIVLDYHRVTKINPNETVKYLNVESNTWDYTERFTIDRKTKALEFIHYIGTGCKVTNKYEIDGEIESLLDEFYENDLFEDLEGNNDKVVKAPDEFRHYRVTIDYEKNSQRVISGYFDENGPPESFEYFENTVYLFMRFYYIDREIFDSSIYQKSKHRDAYYIFCSVVFNGGNKSYYYLTDDDSIEVGDFVIVPVGKDNHVAIVKVVNIEYFNDDDLPLPIDKIKYIIDKCSEDEME